MQDADSTDIHRRLPAFMASVSSGLYESVSSASPCRYRLFDAGEDVSSVRSDH